MRERYKCPLVGMLVLPSCRLWVPGRWTGYTASGAPKQFYPGIDAPRTCVVCGSMKPEAALALARSGWEAEEGIVEGVYYLHPPGRAAYVARKLGYPKPNGVAAEPLRYFAVVPRARLYLPHFTTTQVNEFLKLISLYRDRHV